MAKKGRKPIPEELKAKPTNFKLPVDIVAFLERQAAQGKQKTALVVNAIRKTYGLVRR